MVLQKIRVKSYPDGTFLTGQFTIFPYTDPTIKANIDIRPQLPSTGGYRGSEIWMGSEPFAAAIAPKNCFSVWAPLWNDPTCTTFSCPGVFFSQFFPLYQMGMTVTNKFTQEVCRTTEKGTYTYQTCTGSCATGTDLDPGVKDVAVGKNTRGGGNTDLLRWELIPTDWVKNGYYIRSMGSNQRLYGLGTSGIKYDADSLTNGVRMKPYLKWGAYIGSYADVGYTSDQESANFAAGFLSGFTTGATLGFGDVDLREKNERKPVYFTSFPPQFQTMAYPSHSLYKDLQTLPSQQQGGSKFDDKEYIFVIEPV
jgi:hypothetical protein